MTGWTAPGPGSWELDDAHKVTAYTRTYLDLAGPAIGDGFAALGATYGLPFERLVVAGVRGRLYAQMQIVGAPPHATKAPPAFVVKVLSRVHPGLRKRAAIAAAAVAERRWVVEAERWRATVGPARIAANQALQARVIDAAALDADALATLITDAAANFQAGVREHFRHIGVQLGVARFLVFLDGHGIPTASALALLESPASAAASTQDLATHGYRIVGASDLDGATLVEHPELLDRARTGRHRAPADPDAIRSRLPAGARAAFDEQLADARVCFGLREEEVGVAISWSAGLLRHALLATGIDDVFELIVDEVVGRLRGSPAPDDAEVARRVAERVEAATEVPPRWLGAPPVEPPPVSAFPRAMAELLTAFAAIRRHLDDTTATQGIGIGDAPHTGRARVAVEPDTLLADLEPGDVLVTSITTPAFNAVLPFLGAIVTERGGLLSHPAIAARELGIPAVIGAPGVLTTIPDGATVVVDPTTGTITVAT